MSIMYRDTTLTKIFVGGLPYHTTDESLQKFFDQFGPIEEAVVITDRHSGKSKGYGFVTMADRMGAEKACKDPNPIIDGRKANVNLAYLGAKPRLQAGEIFSLPLNLKTGLTAAYPAHLSRIAPFIQPGAPAFIAAHPATLAPLTTIHPSSIPSSANAPIYPVSPGTPNGTPSPAGGLINYAPTAFAFPQIIHPGFETAPAAYAPFSVIGYISSQPPSTAYNAQPQQPQQPQQQQQQQQQQVLPPGPHSPTFVPALHCVPTQQILH